MLVGNSPAHGQQVSKEEEVGENGWRFWSVSKLKSTRQNSMLYYNITTKILS
jgi:hypothetical protein